MTNKYQVHFKFSKYIHGGINSFGKKQEKHMLYKLISQKENLLLNIDI